VFSNCASSIFNSSHCASICLSHDMSSLGVQKSLSQDWHCQLGGCWWSVQSGLSLCGCRVWLELRVPSAIPLANIGLSVCMLCLLSVCALGS